MRTPEETRFIASFVGRWEYVDGENRCTSCGKWQHEDKHGDNCVYGTILKAVNLHDELVDVLEAISALDALRKTLCGDDCSLEDLPLYCKTKCEHYKIIERFEATLAKAKAV